MANVTYERVNWEDSPSENTPVNGTNLNKMDKGIADCAAEINNLNETVANLSHVGQIIMSTTLSTEASVKAVYGGSQWVKIEGKFLLGASSSHAVNSTGGSETVTLNINQIPSHDHEVRFSNRNDNSIFDDYGNVNQGNYYSTSYWKTSGIGCTTSPSSPLMALAKGGNQAHDNMPPFKAVYIWERTA